MNMTGQVTGVSGSNLTLHPTRYGEPSDAVKKSFSEIVHLIPEPHREALIKGGVRYYALKPGQGLVGSGIFDVVVKTSLRFMIHLIRTIFEP